jgi:hypothetical protein
MISRVKQAIQKSTGDVASSLTDKLRQSALAHGWSKDVVANMHVVHANDEFNVQVHPDYKDRAFVHEYGSESSRPTAVIRKFNNQKGVIHGELLKHITKNYRGV